MRRALAGVLLAATALAAPAQERPAPKRPAILDRTPAELPRAEPGRWAGWDRSRPPEGALRGLFSDAVRAYLREDFPAALEALHATLEAFPDYPPALQQLGVVHFRLRRYGDSALAFERFLEVAPGEVAMTRALGHAHYSLGCFEQARAHYGRVLEQDPEQVEALRGLALAEMRLGRAERALELLARTLELEPGHAEATYWQAQILYDQERAGEALPIVRRAVALDAFEPQPWFLLSQVLYDLGHDEEAEEAQEHSRELDRVAQAARFLEAQLALHPRDATMLRSLAALRGSVGDLERARAAVERLLALDPRSVESHVFALDLSVAMGDEAGAAALARGMEERCAGSASAWERLERYYERIGDRAGVVRAGERRRRLGG